MKVVVQFFGQARLAAGCDQFTAETESGCTAGQLVLKVSEELGPRLREFLYDADGKPRRSTLLIVGERQVGWEDGTPLTDGAIITILPPIAGGAQSR